MFSRFDIAIDTLRVRGRPREAALIAADLRDGGWSVGNNTDWVFIRELTVAAPRHDLRRGASREVRAALQQCVDGTAAAASAANAVRFATLPDLLACLLHDLVQDRPPAWFWRKWQHLFGLPRAEAVTQLLWEHLAQGNAIFDRLWALHTMPALWQILAPIHARILLAKAATLLALPASRLLALAVTTQAVPNAGRGNLAAAFMRQRHDLERWRTLLSSSELHPDKVRLAATLAGLAVMPQAMAQRPEQVMDAFVQLVAVDAACRQHNAAEDTRITTHDRLDSTPQHVMVQSSEIPSSGAARAGGMENAAANAPGLTLPVDAFAIASAQNERTGIFHIDDAGASVQRRSWQQSGADKAASSLPAETAQPDLYLTRHGGVFHLIKALDHPDTYVVLRGNAQWQNLHSGWTLIYQLALALGVEPDGPLQRFFVQAGGFENVAQLQATRHPTLVSLLMRLLRERYAARLNWDVSLLALPARIQASHSNVDVFFDMSAIRLPVRLCGLDVDPGWIPWLGRVVRFHYRDEAGLRVQQVVCDE